MDTRPDGAIIRLGEAPCGTATRGRRAARMWSDTPPCDDRRPPDVWVGDSEGSASAGSPDRCRPALPSSTDRRGTRPLRAGAGIAQRRARRGVCRQSGRDRAGGDRRPAAIHPLSGTNRACPLLWRAGDARTYWSRVGAHRRALDALRPLPCLGSAAIATAAHLVRGTGRRAGGGVRRWAALAGGAGERAADVARRDRARGRPVRTAAHLLHVPAGCVGALDLRVLSSRREPAEDGLGESWLGAARVLCRGGCCSATSRGSPPLRSARAPVPAAAGTSAPVGRAGCSWLASERR